MSKTIKSHMPNLDDTVTLTAKGRAMVGPPACSLCGRPTDLSHFLVAHGPLLKGASKTKRTRVRNIMARFHRRLEEAGFDEVQAHNIVRILAEELRKAGLT